MKSSESILKRIWKEFGIIAIAFVIIMIKSILFLAMLRTKDCASFDFAKTYFQPPAIMAQLCIVLITLSFSFLFKKGRVTYCLILDVLVSIMLIADIWYYRANGMFLSVRHIIHKQLFNPMAKNLFRPEAIDIVFVIDFILLIAFIIFIKFVIKSKIDFKKASFFDNKRRWIAFLVSFIGSVFIIGYSHYYIDIKDGTKGEKMLFKIAWAPFQTMSNMSPLGYHYYDIYRYGFDDGTKKLSDSDKKEIDNWYKDNEENLPDNKYKGMLKGKNLIAIQVESLENFVIGQKVYGQEITPNLNKLLNNSLYFDNIKEQNNSGTSSDCDLMVNTSTLPVREGATFLSYPWAKLPSLPKLLDKDGYTTISAHAETLGDWNWGEVHKGMLGFEKSWDISNFKDDENIGLGLSDGSFMTQIGNKLKNEKQPFYMFFATLTSHGPFDMPEKYKYLKLPKEFDETILGAYFQAVRYTDKQIGNFLNQLNNEGILKNSLVMIYGDHTGVHKFYNDKLKDIKLDGEWWKPNDKKIPFMIYNPEIKGEKFNVAGGQIDFFPTVAYLLGINKDEFEGKVMGRILVNTNRDSSVLNYGDISGNPKSEKEKEHLKNSLKIANDVITGGYYNNK